MEEIIDEVKLLVSEGVKEFQIIAQELTYYGVDLYKSQKLPELIERIANVPGVEWIRLHYAYPAHFRKNYSVLCANTIMYANIWILPCNTLVTIC